MDTFYAIIWFEDGSTFYMVDSSDNPVLLSKQEVLYDEIPILRTRDDINDAEDDIRYAIPEDLLEEIFG